MNSGETMNTGVTMNDGRTLKAVTRIAAAAAAAACFTIACLPAWSAEGPKKNWTPPAQKIYAQKLSDDTMAAAGALQLLVWRTPEGPERDAVVREWKLTAAGRLAALLAEAAAETAAA